MTTTETRMMMIFNEWNRQYSEEPDKFEDSLDENGDPIEDYGKDAMLQFNRIAKEMDNKGLLPIAYI